MGMRNEIVAPRIPAGEQIPAREPSMKDGISGAHGAWILIIGMVILAALKVWLVRHDRMVARPLPVDDLAYLNSAAHWYWRAKYSATAFVRLPAYPLFVALNKLTGLPLRLSTEWVQLVAAAALCLAFFRAGMRRGLCLVLYGAVIFHPATFAQNSYATPDSFFAAILLFAVASMVMQLATRRRWFAALTGLAAGVLWITREESILLMACLGGFVLILLWFWRGSAREVALHALVSGVVIAAVCMAVDTANYLTFGSFAKSDFASRDFHAATMALLRVKPEGPGRRYVSFPREARERAYAASPAFRELQPWLEGPLGASWKQASKPYGIDNDFAHGLFLWAFRDSAVQAGEYRTAETARAFNRRIAVEINAAIARGELAGRFVASDFTDPGFSTYLPYLPLSFARVCGVFVSAVPPAAPLWDSWGLSHVSAKDVRFFRQMSNEPGKPAKEDDRVTKTIREFLARFFGPAVGWLTCVAVAALAFLLLCDGARFLGSISCAVVALLFMLVAGRVIILALIDASAWTAHVPRYLVPVMGPYSCILGILLYEAMQLADIRLRRKNLP